MTVKQLIQALQSMPPDLSVSHLWDGEPRSEINLVWLSRGNGVVTSDYNEVVYSPKSRPVDAPDEPYWHTPKGPVTL